MPDKITYTTNTLIAITLHFWGKGATEKEAVAQVRKAGGSSMLKTHGYIIVSTDDPNFEIDQIDGGVLVHDGKSASIVVDHRKRKTAQPKPAGPTI